MDIAPTILEAAGADIRSPVDEQSMLDLIQHPDAAPWREDIMCQHHGHGSQHFQRLLRHRDYKSVAHLDDKDELYDLKGDPFELENLVDEPVVLDVLQDMREWLCRQMEAHDDYTPDAGQLRHQMC